MHIPDGFLDMKTAGSAAALSTGALAMAVRQTRLHLPQKKVPLMGLAGAFIFAAQMLNFPVPGGTSGHLVGGVLASVLLGPSAAILVITSVLIVQCLVFADGGILSLGANVFNMAVVGSVGGYYIFLAIHRLMPGPRGRLVAVALSSWLTTVVAAICCAGQLALSGTVAWNVGLPAMAGVHMLIGAGEALITTLVVFSVNQTNPELVEARPAERTKGIGELLVFGTLIAMGLALFVSPLASTLPDGLDRVALQLGFSGRVVKERIVSSPIPEYHMPGIQSPAIATAIAGAVGTIVVFGLAVALSKALVPSTPGKERSSTSNRTIPLS